MLVIGWSMSGCSVPASVPEVDYIFEEGLNEVGLAQLDSLFAEFPPDLLATASCDTSGIGRRVDSLMSTMTLREKVAQLLVVPLEPGRGGLASESALEMVRLGVGGFQVPRLMHPEDIAIQSAILQFESRIPLFFAADYERGVGRFNNAWTELPSNMGIGATGNVVNAAAAGRLTGIEARSIGVNLLFAPVLDVNSNPDNPIINIRSFGDSPYIVASMGAAFIEEVQKFGVIATAKHFPGHGSTAVDSHSDVPVVDLSIADLERQDLYPFARLVGSRASPGAMMIGHVAASALDDSGLPASLSSKVIRDYVGGTMGYSGLVITDDLRMGAAARTYSLATRLELALNAGVDILLTPGETRLALRTLINLVSSGTVNTDRLDQAVKNILKAKVASCIGDGHRSHVSLIQEFAPGKAVAEEVARRSITLLGADSLRLKEGDGISLLQVSNFSGAQSIENGMHLFRGLEEEYTGDSTVAVAVLFARLQEGRGTAGLQEGQLDQVRAHLESSGQSMVIVLGNPYLGLHFTDGTPVLIGYDQSESTVRALLEVMRGKQAPTGTLPFEFRGSQRDG